MASEWVSTLVDGQDMRVYLSEPETTGKVPGVLVIMEAFGVNQHVQAEADKLAREGNVAVAPVLYHRLGSNPVFGYTGDDAEARTKAMAGASHWPLAKDHPLSNALRTCSARCWGVSARSTGTRRPTKCAGSKPNRTHTAKSAVSKPTQAPIMASTVTSARATMPRLHKTPGGRTLGRFQRYLKD